MLRHALLLALGLSTACKDVPPRGDVPPAPATTEGSPHANTPPKPHPVLEALTDGRLGIGPFSFTPLKGWTPKPVTSTTHAADFASSADRNDAELIIYYFGERAAGAVDDSVDHWLDQIELADWKSSGFEATSGPVKFAGQDAAFMSMHRNAKPDQVLLAAIIESPSGPYYFKLVGAKATVDAQTDAFRAMLASLALR
jgi:hypothetical protein